jgi:hypothetical protein
MKTYPAPTTALQASWYLAGLDSCISGSKSDDSTHCDDISRGINEENGTNVDDEFSVHAEGAVLQRLCNRHIRVFEICVFAD